MKHLSATALDSLPIDTKEKLYRLAQLEKQFWRRENGYNEGEFQEKELLKTQLSTQFHSLIKLLVEGNVLTVFVDNVMVKPYQINPVKYCGQSIIMTGYAVAQDGIEENDVVRLLNVPPNVV